MNYAYLIKVDPNNNNNKFYEITENSDFSIDVRFGRVGTEGTPHHYSSFDYAHSFYNLINEKQRKGYVDKTALRSSIQRDNNTKNDISQFTPIEDETVNNCLSLLYEESRQFMSKNYTVTVQDITEKMIQEAEKDIEELIKIKQAAEDKTIYNALYYFNDKLIDLYGDIPRKMSHVSDFMAKTEDDFEQIIDSENLKLDNVKSSIALNKASTITPNTPNQNLMEAFGLKVRQATYTEEDGLLLHMGKDYGNNFLVEDRYLGEMLVVENNKTKTAYDQYIKNNNINKSQIKSFFHGSKVENWFNIMRQGLLLNPKASTTGKMFGQGLYFAPDLRKSLNYMDTQGSRWNDGKRDFGYCAVFDVALGKCYEPNYILGGTFKGTDLKNGYLSVFAGKKNPSLGLQNDEYIIYNQDACNIKYLFKMGSPSVPHKERILSRKKLTNIFKDSFSPLEKTSTGIKTTLELNKMGEKEKDKFASELNVDIQNMPSKIIFEYDTKTDKTNLFILDSLNQKINIKNFNLGNFPNITNTDIKFLQREMKKNFAESEIQWKEMIKEAELLKDGEFLDKNIQQIIDNTPSISQNEIIDDQKDIKNSSSNDTKIELFKTQDGIICQQCNCRGAYGAGLSGRISQSFPQVYEEFKQFNKQYPNADDQFGKNQIVTLEDSDKHFLAVANIYTQKDYGDSHKTGIVYTNLDSLINNIKEIAETYSKYPVYIPHSVGPRGGHHGIGCGLAGEKWKNIYPRLKELKLPNLYLINTYTGEKERVCTDKELKKDINLINTHG